AVRTDAQGRGIGAALLTRLLGEALDRGATEMFLEVRSDNPRARELYRRFGCEDIGLRRRYYRDADAIVMRRSATVAERAGEERIRRPPPTGPPGAAPPAAAPPPAGQPPARRRRRPVPSFPPHGPARSPPRRGRRAPRPGPFPEEHDEPYRPPADHGHRALVRRDRRRPGPRLRA